MWISFLFHFDGERGIFKTMDLKAAWQRDSTMLLDYQIYCIVMQDSSQKLSVQSQLHWDTEMQLLPTQVISLPNFSFPRFHLSDIYNPKEKEFTLPALLSL